VVLLVEAAVLESKASETEAADATLANLAKEGNRAAFGSLYERYRRTVHCVLLSHVSYNDAEDLMQAVFVKALQRLHGLREAEAFGGWLMAIARNVAFDHHRRKKNLVDIDEVRDVKAAEQDTPGSESEAALAAIRRLPEAYRETMMLRLVEGMTGPEIAARTNLTADSVRVNLCRGMKLLRAELERKTTHG
jgi:RNA polymerase sigma-70 factor, ECF subfamily